MYKTFSVKIQRILQPFFGRYRQRYRGYRSSLDENRESNFFLIDINRINSQIKSIEEKKLTLANNFVGKTNNFSALEELNHGTSYNLSSDVQIYYYDKYNLNTPVINPLVLPQANKLSSILERLERKVKILESKVGI